jgi:hypothetical protein
LGACRSTVATDARARLVGPRPVLVRGPATCRGTTCSTDIGTTSGSHRLGDGTLAPLGLESERIMAVHAWSAKGTTVVLAADMATAFTAAPMAGPAGYASP